MLCWLLLLIVVVDVYCGFLLLSFEIGLFVLVEMVKQYGIVVMVINYCYYFFVLWFEVEVIVVEGLVGIVMNLSYSWVVLEGGCELVFGINLIVFVWLCLGGELFVFDFVMSVIVCGDIELYVK